MLRTKALVLGSLVIILVLTALATHFLYSQTKPPSLELLLESRAKAMEDANNPKLPASDRERAMMRFSAITARIQQYYPSAMESTTESQRLPVPMPVEESTATTRQENLAPQTQPVQVPTTDPDRQGITEPIRVELVRDGSWISLTRTKEFDVLLATADSEYVPVAGGYFIFIFKNFSNRPVTISTRNFHLIDENVKGSIKIKTAEDLKSRVGRNSNARAFFNALGAMAQGMAGSQQQIDTNISGTYRSTTGQTGTFHGRAQTTISRPDIDAWNREQAARTAAEIQRERRGWNEWIDDLILKDTTVLPGEKLIRFIATNKFNKKHQNHFFLQVDNVTAWLKNVERGFR